MSAHRLAVIVGGAIALLGSAVAPSHAVRPCGSSGYSYAGLAAASPAAGISAVLAIVVAPRVRHGHVAAWVGVGGSGLGPRGTDQWLQIGLAARAGKPVELYYEVALPGRRPAKVTLRAPISPRTTLRVAVLEMRGRTGTWRAWVGDRPVSPPIHLPESHGRFRPVATTETWDGGVTTCNRYVFRFADVRVAAAPGGRWRPLADRHWLGSPGYSVLRLSQSTFLAGRDD